MTRPLPTHKVFVGESLPVLGLFYRENGVLLTGLASGHAFELKIATLDGEVVETKTTDITGQAGAGFPPLGTPNIVIAWSSELAALTAGTTYRAQLKITSSGGVRFVEFLLEASTVF